MILDSNSKSRAKDAKNAKVLGVDYFGLFGGSSAARPAVAPSCDPVPGTTAPVAGSM
jgi:hypothetical protein